MPSAAGRPPLNIPSSFDPSVSKLTAAAPLLFAVYFYKKYFHGWFYWKYHPISFINIPSSSNVIIVYFLTFNITPRRPPWYYQTALISPDRHPHRPQDTTTDSSCRTKQARKLQATLVRVRNYYRLTYSLTGVKCRATSVAKKSFDTSKFFLIFTFKFMLETNQTTVHILFSKLVCPSCPFFSTSTVSVFPEGSSHVSVFS